MITVVDREGNKMALSADMRFWINALIFNNLDDICPLLSLTGEDRKVYEICIEDFKNYVDYLDRNHIRVDKQVSPDFLPSQQAVIEEIISIITKNSGFIQNLQDTKEVEEFVHSWVRLWWKKWQYRTKIVFKQEPHMINVDAHLTSNDFTGEEINELTCIVIDKLIQYGEICCANIIANALIKKDIQAAQKSEWTTQDKLNLIPRLQREAKEMSYTHGPLVFIKANKEYGLREWRDDGTTNKIV